MPITEQVNAVFFEGKKADDAVKELMIRDRQTECFDIPWRNA